MAKGMHLVVPQCEVGTCADGENPEPAAWVLGQIEQMNDAGDAEAWRFVLVCERHAEGWWDKADKPGQRTPSYRMYTTSFDPSD